MGVGGGLTIQVVRLIRLPIALRKVHNLLHPRPREPPHKLLHPSQVLLPPPLLLGGHLLRQQRPGLLQGYPDLDEGEVPRVAVVMRGPVRRLFAQHE